jgi:hypothetical protein
MARRHSRASNVPVSPRGDDFTLIKGIGPKIKTRLQGAGILTFAQLGALSAEEISSVATGLSTKRIARENWIGQARQLARKRVKRARTQPCKRRSPPTNRQHYATFTVELLLDEINDVRRIRCAHIQSGDQETWAGWEEARLVGFVVEHAGLRIPRGPMPVPATRPEAAQPPTVTVHPVLPPIPEATPGPAPVLAAEAGLEQQGGAREIMSLHDETLHGPFAAIRASAQGYIVRHAETIEDKAQSNRLVLSDKGGVGGVLRLFELAAMSTDSDQPCQILSADTPFRVRLSLDLTGVVRPPDVPLDCITSIYAKRLGGGSRQILGEARDAIKLSDKAMVEVRRLTLSPGLYRLYALVQLNPSSPGQAPRGLMAMLKGGPIQVY